jgi:hypothetical protein
MDSNNPPPKQVNSKDDSEFHVPPAKRQRIGESATNGDGQSVVSHESVPSLNAEVNSREHQGGIPLATGGASLSQSGDKTEPISDQRTWRKGEAPVKAELVVRPIV